MATTEQGQSTKTHLEEFRAAKDHFYRTSSESPLTAKQREGFTGLSYFPENASYVFVVDGEQFERPETVDMLTSTGDTTQYVRWATATIEVDGKRHALTVFRNPDTGSLFLPFQDSLRGT